MAIYHLTHRTVGRTTHAPGTAGAHLGYITRASACRAVIAEHIPEARPGSKGGEARAWMDAAEEADRKNARVIDKLEIALPLELDQAQRVELVRAFVKELAGGQVVPFFAAFHDKEGTKDAANPHAHIVIRDRDPATGKGRIIGMSEKGSTERAREVWERICNEALKQAGTEARIDRRSLVDQGITDRDPTKHVGPAAVGIEADGRKSWKAEVVREEATEAREAAQRATEAREAAQDEAKRLRIEAARKAEAESLEAIRMEIRNARARDRQIQEDAPLYFEAVKDLLKDGCQPVRRPTEYDKDIEKWTFWAFLNREEGGPLRNLIGAKDTDGPLKIRTLFDFDLRGFTNFKAFKRDAFQENPYLENDLNRHSEFAETILQARTWADIADELDDWGRALLVQTGELFCKLVSKFKAPTSEPNASTPKPEPEPPQTYRSPDWDTPSR